MSLSPLFSQRPSHFLLFPMGRIWLDAQPLTNDCQWEWDHVTGLDQSGLNSDSGGVEVDPDRSICLFMKGTSGTKGNRLNLLKSNRSKIIFTCPLRHVEQEMFHEADEILTNVTSPLRFNSHQSSSLSLPCGRKIYSSVKCYLLTEKYEI